MNKYKNCISLNLIAKSVKRKRKSFSHCIAHTLAKAFIALFELNMWALSISKSYNDSKLYWFNTKLNIDFEELRRYLSNIQELIFNENIEQNKINTSKLYALLVK